MFPNQNQTLPASPAQTSSAGTLIVRSIGIVFLVCGFIPLVIGIVILAGDIASLANSKTTTATVQTISQNVVTAQRSIEDYGDASAAGTYCTFTYTYNVHNREYIGSDTNGALSNCNYRKGDTVQVKYNPSHPASSNTKSISSWIIGIVFSFGAIVPFGIGMLLIWYAHKAKERLTQSGHATAAQLALIENGMQDLGEFWEPKKSMTQAEAQQALDDINKRLKSEHSTPEPPSSF